MTIEKLEKALADSKMAPMVRTGERYPHEVETADGFVIECDTPEQSKAIMLAVNALPSLLAVVKAAKRAMNGGDQLDETAYVIAEHDAKILFAALAAFEKDGGK